MVGVLDIFTVIRFLHRLGNAAWALHGCSVIHDIHCQIHAASSSSDHVVHVPELPLAFYVRSLVQGSDGDTKCRATQRWVEWFGPTVRAIVTSQPVTITSWARDEVLYAPGKGFSRDSDGRHLFTWKTQWSADNRKEQFVFVPVDATRNDRFFVRSVSTGEDVYACGEIAKAAPGSSPVYLRQWKDETVVPEREWQLISLRPLADRDAFALYNPHSRQCVCSPDVSFDKERRHVYAAAYPSGTKSFMWRVAPVQQTAFEAAVEAFHAKKYSTAVETFGEALRGLPDRSTYVKCLIYRAVTFVRLDGQQGAAADAARQRDSLLLNFANHDTAVLLGLGDLWEELLLATGDDKKATVGVGHE